MAAQCQIVKVAVMANLLGTTHPKFNLKPIYLSQSGNTQIKPQYGCFGLAKQLAHVLKRKNQEENFQ